MSHVSSRDLWTIQKSKVFLFSSRLIMYNNLIIASSVVHTLAEGTHGTWKKKWTWKQRWVKNWKPKTVYVAHWWVFQVTLKAIVFTDFVCDFRTRVWTPAEINEYVPLPSIPQNWVKPTEHCWDSSSKHFPFKTELNREIKLFKFQ